MMRRIWSRSDAELLAATPRDPDAFAELYRRHERSILGYFMHWCRSSELAADLMAETFAAGFESAARYRPQLGEPRAWLFGIARHVLLRSVRRGRVEDAVRRRLGMAVLALDDEALERVETLGSGRRDVAEALEGLSAVLREAVAGRVIQEREYRELAESLQCSESVVRQRVRRGLVQMRTYLEAER
jgi:RNA polymerase sigma-70 factor (ECF subfamily)